MSVKRFNQWCAVTHGHNMIETGDGLFVLASDYDALAARLAEAERLLRLWERWDGMEDGVPSPHYDTHVWLTGTTASTVSAADQPDAAPETQLPPVTPSIGAAMASEPTTPDKSSVGG